jgi:hypothetical protein
VRVGLAPCAEGKPAAIRMRGSGAQGQITHRECLVDSVASTARLLMNFREGNTPSARDQIGHFSESAIDPGDIIERWKSGS